MHKMFKVYKLSFLHTFSLHIGHSLDIPTSIKIHSVLSDELSKPSNGLTAKKHLCQMASLLGQLQEAKLLGSDTCYVEFGAGRGKYVLKYQKRLMTQCRISNVYF